MKWYGWVLLALLATSVGLYKLYADARDDLATSKLKYTEQVAINDSTNAILAGSEVDKKNLKALLDAADLYNGKLLAALKIHVAPRDTTIIHEIVPTDMAADSTRTAHFKDSTFAGTIEGTITAPPCCAELGIKYNIHRPEFNPQIGFIQKGDKTIAVVSWQGEEFKVEAPYGSPVLKQQKLLGYFAKINWNTDNNWKVGGGVLMRLPKQMQLRAGVDSDKKGYVEFNKDF